ncbi:MAG: hypothetical protein KAI83_05195 [Thiomargarita sp.]|nr:hypothetical protein [Thiomargarita sp.]
MESNASALGTDLQSQSVVLQAKALTRENGVQRFSFGNRFTKLKRCTPS